MSHNLRHGRARVLYPRGTHEAEATGEVDWWDRTRAENITITITITGPAHAAMRAGHGRGEWRCSIFLYCKPPLSGTVGYIGGSVMH